MVHPEPLHRSPAEQAAEEAFLDLYGPWDPLTPLQVAEVLRGFERPWWIVGGWAIDAATGVPREHEDVDVSMRGSDVPALYELLKSEWHLWNNNDGALHPLTDADPAPREPVNQLWLRRNARAPWVMDVILVPDRDGLWVSRRDPNHVASIEDVTWVHEDGIRYQRPELVLFFKAKDARPKDERDLVTTWPALDDPAQDWLRARIDETYPDHRWVAVIDELRS
jgi:hypothetical protein